MAKLIHNCGWGGLTASNLRFSVCLYIVFFVYFYYFLLFVIYECAFGPLSQHYLPVANLGGKIYHLLQSSEIFIPRCNCCPPWAWGTSGLLLQIFFQVTFLISKRSEHPFWSSRKCWHSTASITRKWPQILSPIFCVNILWVSSSEEIRAGCVEL